MTADDEPRYTLPEARAEIARQECVRFGHTWDVMEKGGRPRVLVCGRCGQSHKVADEQTAKNAPPAETDGAGRELPEAWQRADVDFEAYMQDQGVSYLVTEIDGVRFVAPLASPDPGAPVSVVPPRFGRPKVVDRQFFLEKLKGPSAPADEHS